MFGSLTRWTCHKQSPWRIESVDRVEQQQQASEWDLEGRLFVVAVLVFKGWDKANPAVCARAGAYVRVEPAKKHCLKQSSIQQECSSPANVKLNVVFVQHIL